MNEHLNGFPGALFCVSRGLNFFSSATVETFPDPIGGHGSSYDSTVGIPGQNAKRQETVVIFMAKYHANT